MATTFPKVGRGSSASTFVFISVYEISCCAVHTCHCILDINAQGRQHVLTSVRVGAPLPPALSLHAESSPGKLHHRDTAQQASLQESP